MRSKGRSEVVTTLVADETHGSQDSFAVHGVLLVDRYENQLSDAAQITATLLRWLDKGLLAGLSSIVLTDSASLDPFRSIRVEGRSVSERDCKGFYHRQTKSRAPWIELVTDNIVKSLPKQFRWFRVFRELAVARTLFHELGHHRARVVGGVRRHEREADRWSQQMVRSYFRQVHPVLFFFARRVLWLHRLVRRG